MLKVFLMVVLFVVNPFEVRGDDVQNGVLGSGEAGSQNDQYSELEATKFCLNSPFKGSSNATSAHFDNISTESLSQLIGLKKLPCVEKQLFAFKDDDNELGGYDFVSDDLVGDIWLAYEVEARGSKLHDAILENTITQLLSEDRFYDVLDVLHRISDMSEELRRKLRKRFLKDLSSVDEVFLLIDIVEKIKPWFTDQRLASDIRALAERLSSEGFPKLSHNVLFYVELPSRWGPFESDVRVSESLLGSDLAIEQLVKDKASLNNQAEIRVQDIDRVTVLEAQRAVTASEDARTALAKQFLN